MNVKKPISILDDVGPLVDEWLQLTSKGNPPKYRHKSAANQIVKRGTVSPSSNFLSAAYQQINHNWQNAVTNGRCAHSKTNWRFTKRSIQSKTGHSAEVDLERAIIREADENWGNQVPTSSGLVAHRSDKTRNIDLVQRGSNGHYSLIELKVASNNPLFAAIEILLNGLLLSWSRNNRDKLKYDPVKQPLLNAASIDLCVLAPSQFYENYGHRSLLNLSDSINEGLMSCANTLAIPISFQFTKFGQELNSEQTPQQQFELVVSRIPAL